MSKTQLLSAAALAALLPAAALAQASASDADVQDRIIVTAPGPDRLESEYVFNATALDREDIVEQLGASLGNTLEGEPGVSTTFFGQAASRPVLRGLGAGRVRVLTNGIGVIDASAASPDHQVAADGIDATRIEILRGPAALTYGGEAIGGVVNVFDGLIAEAAPENGFDADGFVAYNSVSEGVEGGVRAQAAAGPLVFTFTASGRDFDDYEIPGEAESARFRALEALEGDHDHDDDHDDDHHDDHDEDHDDEHDHDHDEHDHDEHGGEGIAENSFAETASLGAGVSFVSDRGYFGLSVRQQISEYGLPGHSHEHGHGHESEHDDDHDEDHDDEHDEHDDHEHGEEEDAAFIDLEQTRIDLRGGLVFDSGPITRVTGNIAFAEYAHTEFEGPGEAGTEFDNEGYEARAEADTLFGPLAGTVGAQWKDQDFSAIGAEAFLSPTETQQAAVFVYQTYEAEGVGGIEAGLRFENTERDNILFGSRDFDTVSGSLGLHRHLGGNWFAGVQGAYSERSPSSTELFAFGPHLATRQFEVGNPDLAVEEGRALEATLRYEGEMVSVGINAFSNSFNDFIYLAPGEAVVDGEVTDEGDGLPVFLFTQDDADFIGFELYGDMVFDANGAELELSGALDVVETELSGGGGVPLVPPLRLTGGASLEFDAFEIGGRVTWADDQDEPGPGYLPTDGYTRIDLRGELDIGELALFADNRFAEHAELFIEARNVTDEEIRFATSTLKDLLPAPGRNIRVGLRVSL